MSEINPEADLRACEAATKGPWEWYNGCSWWRLGIAGDEKNHAAVICPRRDTDGHPNLDCNQRDKDFITLARTKLPDYIRAYQEQAKEIERLRAALGDI